MSTLNKKATPNTPQVVYSENDELLIKGRSILQDVNSFYQPLIDWAANLQLKRLSVNIDLEYMNSASAKKMLVLLKKLDSNNHIEELIITWHYEDNDEETLISGQIFEKLLNKADFRYSEHKET